MLYLYSTVFYSKLLITLSMSSHRGSATRFPARLPVLEPHYCPVVAGVNTQCIVRSWITNMAKAAVEPKLCVWRRWNRTRHLTSSRSISSPSVFGFLKLYHCAEIIQVPCLVTRTTNQPIHTDQYPQGWLKGAIANKVPLLQFKPHLLLSKLTPCLFFLFELIFLSFGIRQGGGKEPELGCWGAETCQALKTSAERWDFIAGMLELWLGMKKTGHTGNHWCQGLQAW